MGFVSLVKNRRTSKSMAVVMDNFLKILRFFIRFLSGNHSGVVHVSKPFGKYYFTQFLFSTAGVNTPA